MKKARMNISHSRFSLLKLKIFDEIATTYFFRIPNFWFKKKKNVGPVACYANFFPRLLRYIFKGG